MTSIVVVQPNKTIIYYDCQPNNPNNIERCFYVFDTTDPKHWKTPDFVICKYHMNQIKFEKRKL